MSLLKWALFFLVIAAIAALFGFGGIAQGSADIAKVLFFVFIAGSLYDPPRALSQLGPEAAAMGWRIKTAFYR